MILIQINGDDDYDEAGGLLRLSEQSVSNDKLRPCQIFDRIFSEIYDQNSKRYARGEKNLILIKKYNESQFLECLVETFLLRLH